MQILQLINPRERKYGCDVVSFLICSLKMKGRSPITSMNELSRTSTEVVNIEQSIGIGFISPACIFHGGDAMMDCSTVPMKQSTFRYIHYMEIPTVKAVLSRQPVSKQLFRYWHDLHM